MSASRRKKATFFLIAVLVLTGAAAWLLHSGEFQSYVRNKLITQLTTATGGRAEIRQLRVNWWRLELWADDVTIHGTEPAAELPYAHADELYLRLKVSSLFTSRVNLSDLRAERPVIHLIVAADGQTNQPLPKSTSAAPIQQLFDLGIERLQLSNGTLIVNDRQIPFDLQAEDTDLSLIYKSLAKDFDGKLRIGKLDSAYGNLRPFASSIDAQFTIHPESVGIASLQWKSQNSWLKATGEITNLANPVANLNYSAHLDLWQFGNVIRNHELRGGEVDAQGSASYQDQQLLSSGNVRASDVAWRSSVFDATNLTARTPYTLNPKSIALNDLQGRWAGGSFRGKARIENWKISLSGNERVAKTRLPQTGAFALSFTGMSLKSLADAVQQFVKMRRKLKMDSLVSGKVSGEWRGTLPKATIQVAADLQPPSQSPAGNIPLSGHVEADLNLAGEYAKIANTTLQTPASRLIASGELGHAASHLQIEFHTSDLNEVAPVLSRLLMQNPPCALRGNADVNAVLSGKLKQPSISGAFQAQNVDAVLPLASLTYEKRMRASGQNASGGDVYRKVHFDSVAAKFTLSPTNANLADGTLRSGGAVVQFSGSANLSKYQLLPTSVFSAQLLANRTPVNDLQAFIGTNYPITGSLNLKLQAGGTRESPQASGKFTLNGGSAYNIPFQSLSGEVKLVGKEVEAKSWKLAFRSATAIASGRYDLQTQAFNFQLNGQGFDLSRIPAFQRPRFSAQGNAALVANGSGTLSQPVINADLSLNNLVLNGERTGDLTLHAVTRGREMQLTGRSNFERANIVLDGAVHLGGSFPAQAKLTFTHLDIDPFLLSYLQGRVTEHSSMDGWADLRGSLRNPDSVIVNGQLQNGFVDVENVKLQTAQPVDFSIRNRLFSFNTLHIVGEGTNLNAGGSAMLRAGGAINISATGSLNLQVLESFNPNLISNGVTTIAMHAGGTITQPSLTGKIQIQNAGFSLLDLPSGLSGMNGTLLFNQDRLQIESLTAHTGGGILDISGFIAYAHGLYFNLDARGREIRLRYPPGVSAVGDADLKFQGSAQDALLSGDVNVTKFSLNQQFDFALYVARANEPPSVPSPDSLLNNIHLNVHILTARELDVEMSLAKISGDADLHVTGTAARPVVLGRVNVNEGTVNFNGTRYQLDRGSILMINPTRTEPILDLQSSARVRDYDVTLTFHGPLDKLTSTYRSDPPLPTADIISLLALGHTRQNDVAYTSSEPSLATSASGELLGAALNATVSSRVQKLFGISRIKIDPIGNNEELTSTTQANRGPTITVEQQVSDRLTLTYISNLAQSSQQVIEVEFQINKNTSFDAIRDQNGVVGLDIKLRQRKR